MMDQWVSGWLVAAGVAMCGLFGIVAMRRRRVGKMRRMMRRAGKTMSGIASAMLSMFS